MAAVQLQYSTSDYWTFQYLMFLLQRGNLDKYIWHVKRNGAGAAAVLVQINWF